MTPESWTTCDWCRAEEVGQRTMHEWRTSGRFALYNNKSYKYIYYLLFTNYNGWTVKHFFIKQLFQSHKSKGIFVLSAINTCRLYAKCETVLHSSIIFCSMRSCAAFLNFTLVLYRFIAIKMLVTKTNVELIRVPHYSDINKKRT